MSAMWAALTQAAVSVAAVVAETAAAVGVVNGGAGMTNCLPGTFQNGHSARTRRLKQRACAVDRAVMDQWLTWRN